MRDAIIDWCGFTVPAESVQELPADMVHLVKRFMPTANIGDSPGAPRNFYRYTSNVYAFVGFEPVLVAMICWGGDRQRDTVNVQINGKGCSLVQDWSIVREWLNANDGRLTRCDTAVDFMDGEYSVDAFFDLFKSGGFNWNNAPKHRLSGPWGIETDEGRTLYVGKKENGKEFCCYEKGKQLLPGSSPWTRAEIRFFSKDRVLPLEMLTSPSKYVAGAYPCFAEVMAREGERVPTDQNEYDMTADRYTEYLRRCAGKIIHTLRGTYKSDADMLDQLAVIGIPKRLRKASLVLIRGTVPPSTEYVTAAELNAQPFEFGAKYRSAAS